MKLRIAILVAALVMGGSALAQTKPKRTALGGEPVESVLWVGNTDKRHPTLIGTYLAACTTYAAVYGKSPVGNTYLAGIDPATAQFLQTVAQETVQEYYGR